MLQSLPYVDPHRIGAIGHSLGANGYFLAAVVSSCGFFPFLYDPNLNRWGQRNTSGLGQKNNYVSLLGNEIHDFPEYIRTIRYRFLDRWLQEENGAKQLWQMKCRFCNNFLLEGLVYG